VDGATGAVNVGPGGAGGAKAAPVNGLSTMYGESGDSLAPADFGLVVIRLTQS
jgi:hypothetical protein